MSFEHYNKLVNIDYLPKTAVYSFQFYYYIKNCSIRFNFGSFSTALSTILYQTVVYCYVNDIMFCLRFYSSASPTLLQFVYHSQKHDILSNRATV